MKNIPGKPKLLWIADTNKIKNSIVENDEIPL